MLLQSEEEWVCVNWSLQISCKHHFDFASCQQILDAQVWQLGPLGERVGSNEVGKLVDTCTLGFLFSLTLLTFYSFGFTFIAGFNVRFHYVIVALQSVYFSKEAEGLGSPVCCKLFERFLQPIDFLLAKTDARPLIDVALSHQILYSSNRSTCIAIITSIFTCLDWFGKKFLCFIYIRLLFLSKVHIGSDFLNLEVFVELKTMSDEIRNLLELV